MNRIACWGALVIHLCGAPALFAQSDSSSEIGPLTAQIAEPWLGDAAFEPSLPFLPAEFSPSVPRADTDWFSPTEGRKSPIAEAFSAFAVPSPAADDFGSDGGLASSALPDFDSQRRPLFRSIWEDQVHYYHWSSLRYLVAPIAAGAVLANTSFDRHFQQDVKFSDAFHDCKTLGNGSVVLPTLGTLALAGRLFDRDTVPGGIGSWSERSLRAAATGAPTLLLLQYTLGGSRPGESPLGSHWHPFADNNGVSGHAYIGAIPMLTAARFTERPLLKAALIGGSTLAGVSRITDENHYLSQVIIGWSIAWVAVAAVNQTETGEPPRFMPFIGPNAVGFGYVWQH